MFFYLLAYLILLSPFVAFLYAMTGEASSWAASGVALTTFGLGLIVLLPLRARVGWLRQHYTLRRQLVLAIFSLACGLILMGVN